MIQSDARPPTTPAYPPRPNWEAGGSRRVGVRLSGGGMSSTKGWTPEEDALIVSLVNQHGIKKWSVVAAELPGRNGKQVRALRARPAVEPAPPGVLRLVRALGARSLAPARADSPGCIVPDLPPRARARPPVRCTRSAASGGTISWIQTSSAASGRSRRTRSCSTRTASTARSGPSSPSSSPAAPITRSRTAGTRRCGASCAR